MSDELTEQDKKNLTYMALLLLASKGDAIIPELLYLLDNASFLKLVKTYPAQTIRIPSGDEITKALQVVMYYAEVLIRGESSKDFFRKAGVTRRSKRRQNKIHEDATMFRNHLKSEKYRIPAYFLQSDLLKTIQLDLFEE